ncbi:bifunctional 2-polyprenyl-6-hydroxyphenol methylase/3-demethylubiquinol 3-O-methyltransferase UbiG [Mangrovibacterium marinum]|uniref:Methyltransferase family protein n=1 Tax=Mangrovibacterium marinum TaxID=1639118 RepID=A0A2T5C3S1_9BACT|nr:methyltransferase domain-containing protein [Mangrovibacterium marinum]PTN09411.1 methyltransferase family protein [Mangrovibacterium marinum]
MPIYDPIGLAVHNFHFKKEDKPVVIYADDFDPDKVLPSYFFRSFEQMPALEQLALKKARGRVLDIGACAGCHSLYLQDQGYDVTALEQSALCCEVMKDRGLRQVIHSDLFGYHESNFDSLLLLMNGTGIAGNLANFQTFLKQLKSLLAPEGQILIDSSDLIYLYLDDDGSACVDINATAYYGEMNYQVEYNQQKGEAFPWLYLDPESLAKELEKAELRIESIDEGDHYDYLATIKHI